MIVRFNDVAVLGLGKVGLLAAAFLHEAGCEVTGYDLRVPTRPTMFPTEKIDVTDCDAIASALQGKGAVLSCLPYHLNRTIATIAHRCGVHYFDLTEDVHTTRAVTELAPTASALMAPQCGLAPGFISIVAASEIAGFDLSLIHI